MDMPRLQPVDMALAEISGFWRRTAAWMWRRRLWMLSDDWHHRLPDGTEIVIPRGFISDGASAPRLLWAFMPPAGPLLIPSLIHDFAYRYDYLWQPDGQGGFRRYREGAGWPYWDHLFGQLCIQQAGRMLMTVPAERVMNLLGRLAWRRHRRHHYPELRPGQDLSP